VRRAAEVYVRELLCLQPGETLLIYTDAGSAPAVVRAVEASAQEIGARVERLDLGAWSDRRAMTGELTAVIAAGRYEAICELSEDYFYQTAAWSKAVELGGRIYALTGLDAEAFCRCIGQVDHAQMYALGAAIHKILRRTSHLRITSRAGTDLAFPMRASTGARALLKLRGIPRPQVFSPTGRPVQRGNISLLGGQVSWQGNALAMNGAVVVDGFLWPPREIGRLQQSLVLTVRGGQVRSIAGPPAQVRLLDQWYQGRRRSVQHLSIGYHPYAQLSGKINEAERIFGGLTLGIGAYPVHADGVLRQPTIWADEELLAEAGAFVHPELLQLCRAVCPAAVAGCPDPGLPQTPR